MHPVSLFRVLTPWQHKALRVVPLLLVTKTPLHSSQEAIGGVMDQLFPGPLRKREHRPLPWHTLGCKCTLISGPLECGKNEAFEWMTHHRDEINACSFHVFHCVHVHVRGRQIRKLINVTENGLQISYHDNSGLRSRRFSPWDWESRHPPFRVQHYSFQRWLSSLYFAHTSFRVLFFTVGFSACSLWWVFFFVVVVVGGSVSCRKGDPHGPF